MTPFGWRLMGGTVPGMGTDHLTRVGTALAWVLIGVSVVDVATGRWLWQDRRRGSIVGLATTPVSFGLGLLFQVPFSAHRPTIAGRPRDRCLVAAVDRALGNEWE